jgi:hypothetical protein
MRHVRECWGAWGEQALPPYETDRRWGEQPGAPPKVRYVTVLPERSLAEGEAE